MSNFVTRNFDTNSSFLRRATFLFAGCLLFHICGTWIVPLIDRDEPRFAEASREMIERSDYVVPYFNDEFRFDKPPFTYWAQSTSYRVFGDNDFAARFPSGIAAALAAVVLLAWGRRLGSDRIGLWAAIVFSLSFQVVEHAKAAVADMWLVLFVTSAHWAGYELLFGSKRRTFNVRWWTLFYVSLALAFLAKGPIGWTPLLTTGLTILFLRDREALGRFKYIRGLLLTLAIVSAWGIPALIRTQGAFLQVGIGRHVLGRSVMAMGGHGASSLGIYLLLLPFYFVTIFVSFFPWSIRLPWLVRQMRERRDHLDVYLLSGIAVVFVIFTFVTTKLLHYTLPAFPLLALLLARRWLSAGQPTAGLQRTAIGFAALCVILALGVAPVVAPLFPSRELFRQAKPYLVSDMSWGAQGYTEPSLVWYFRSRVRGFMQTSGMHPEKLPAFMEQPGARFVVVPTDIARRLYPNIPAGWKTVQTRGFNAVKGKRSDLTLLLKPE